MLQTVVVIRVCVLSHHSRTPLFGLGASAVSIPDVVWLYFEAYVHFLFFSFPVHVFRAQLSTTNYSCHIRWPWASPKQCEDLQTAPTTTRRLPATAQRGPIESAQPIWGCSRAQAGLMPPPCPVPRLPTPHTHCLHACPVLVFVCACTCACLPNVCGRVRVRVHILFLVFD